MNSTTHAVGQRFSQPPIDAQIESKATEIIRLAEQHDAEDVAWAVRHGRDGELRDAIEALDDEHLQSELTHWLEELEELEAQL